MDSSSIFLSDGFWLLVVILLIPISFMIQANVKKTFEKWGKVKTENGVTAEQVARKILESYDIHDVGIEAIPGNLTDHYDPRDRVLRLSQNVYGSNSVAAIGVAAHEVGHAIQHNRGYFFLQLRNAIVPAVNFASSLSIPLIFLGFILQAFNLITIGIALYAVMVAFHIITLPVELDASHRALKILSLENLLNPYEVSGARQVLNAAAMTYIIAALAAAANLIRFILLSRRNN